MFLKWIAPHMGIIAILLAAVIQPLTAQPQHTVSVQLLAINDFHGNLQPPAGADGQVNNVPAGGAEYLATHLRNAGLDNPNSILVAAGDLMGASPLISGLFHDGPTIESMNAMNLAVTSIGNHELDHGVVDLLHRIEGGCLRDEGCRDGEQSAGAKFRYLEANLVTSDPLPLPATAVRTIGGVKIGFIGETLQGTGRILSPRAAQGLQFLEESSVANQAAARLERDGVHAIVLLIHQGGQQHPASGPADPNGCENFQGDIKAVVDRLSPAVKVVISGHTHQFYNCVIAGHTVTSAGSFGRLFTRVNLDIDPATGTIVSLSAKNEVVTRDVPRDPAQTAILERYRSAAERTASRVVGSISTEITRTENPAGESALGDLIADAQLESVSSPALGGAVIAFMNSGGIRTNLNGTVRASGQRDVSFGDLYTVQPFANQIAVVTMTGALIRQLLEQQFQSEGAPQILQVSEGFTYQYRLHAASGQHVIPDSIKLRGHKISPSDQLRVEASYFLLAGGEGLTIFRQSTNAMGGPVDLDALVAYLGKHSPIAPGLRNRIVRTD